MLLSEGAYTFTDNRPRFHRARVPTDADLSRLLDTLIHRITHTLIRSGALVQDPDQPWFDIEAGGALEQLAGAAVRYRIAVGPMAGRKTMTLHRPDAVSGENLSSKPLTATRDGFSLNAAVLCEPPQPDKLERLCRYVSRGPIALDRLTIDGDGLVVYELKRPLSNGTAHVLFAPLNFMARLAALIPRPRVHLARYHGLFAPNARHPHLIVRRYTPAIPADDNHDVSANSTQPNPTTPMSWMQRLRRVFQIDLSHCPRCGGTVRVVASITEPALINPTP